VGKFPRGFVKSYATLLFDTTVEAMALTAKEINSKCKETSESGLAMSLVLC
jgi:L-serine deaminase